MSKKRKTSKETISLKSIAISDDEIMKSIKLGISKGKTITQIFEELLGHKFDDDPKNVNESKENESKENELKKTDERRKLKVPDVSNPGHYKSALGVECMDLIEDRLGDSIAFGFCVANAFKYLFRCKHKHETCVEDVRKAKWYLDRAVVIIDRNLQIK